MRMCMESTTETITEYEKKRLEFECRRVNLLCANPHLQPLQNKIDLALKKAGSKQHNRCVIMNTLMFDEVGKLLDAIEELKTDVTLLAHLHIEEANKQANNPTQ